MKRVLVYSPHIGGHRPIYCQRICRSLARYGCEVFLLAVGHQKNATLRVFADVKSEYIDSLSELSCFLRIQDFDLSELYLNEPRFIRDLQRKWKVDVTLLVNGDEALPMLLRMTYGQAQKFEGKTVGLFINSEWVHNGGDDVCSLPLRTVSYRSFFRQVGEGKSVLDGVIVTDDVLAESYGSNSTVCFHLPDITLPASNPIAKAKADTEKVRALVDRFIERNVGRRLVLFFGDLEKRKGFDFLLRFCSEEDDTILLRIGRTKPGYTPGGMEDVSCKSKLVIEDRILEIDAFIEDIDLVNYFFKLANFIPLPYHRFLRTSGLMLEAVARGLPVIVSDVGLMSVRVEKYGLGLVFKAGSYEDFAAKLKSMFKVYINYRKNLDDYAKNYSEESIDRSMAWMLRPAVSLQGKQAIGALLRVQKGDLSSLRKDLVCYAWNTRSTKRALALERFFKVATRERIAVFGGGEYARWLAAMSAARDDLRIEAVLDNRPDPDGRLWNLKPELASTFNPSGIDAIVLATEVFPDDMRADCRRYFGEGVKVIALN